MHTFAMAEKRDIYTHIYTHTYLIYSYIAGIRGEFSLFSVGPGPPREIARPYLAQHILKILYYAKMLLCHRATLVPLANLATLYVVSRKSRAAAPPPPPVNNRDHHPLSKIASSTPPPPSTIATTIPCQKSRVAPPPPPPSTISWPPHHYFWPHPGHPTEKFLATPLAGINVYLLQGFKLIRVEKGDKLNRCRGV